MAAPLPNLTVNGVGLELAGLCYAPQGASAVIPGTTYVVIDGIGLVTKGFIWNSANYWAMFFTQINPGWTASATCTENC
jgi:hypothetical protein